MLYLVSRSLAGIEGNYSPRELKVEFHFKDSPGTQMLADCLGTKHSINVPEKIFAVVVR